MIETVKIIETVLGDLKKVRGVEACAVASRDGLLIRAIQQEEGQRSDSFAAMSATMFGAAETATTVLGKGIPKRVIAESDHGYLCSRRGVKGTAYYSCKFGCRTGLDPS
jgi:predicted regulator of Ras-like GTPase activity (Roadblock/LC7/MglB family)